MSWLVASINKFEFDKSVNFFSNQYWVEHKCTVNEFKFIYFVSFLTFVWQISFFNLSEVRNLKLLALLQWTPLFFKKLSKQRCENGKIKNGFTKPCLLDFSIFFKHWKNKKTNHQKVIAWLSTFQVTSKLNLFWYTIWSPKS